MARPSRSTSIQAPVGGWNTRDSIADMGPMYAPIMTNWYPSATDVMLRKGYSEYSTGLVNEVESLMVYASSSTKMFAAAGTDFFDVTQLVFTGAGRWIVANDSASAQP